MAALEAQVRHLFQFTPLREGRLNCQTRDGGQRNFNSRPSARGDTLVQRLACLLVISIHAPPRGATRRFLDDLQKQQISIHAPPRGATRHDAGGSHADAISIHAPPRGATELLASRAVALKISIHAPPRGATNVELVTLENIEFQFTPLREGRPNGRSRW